MSDLMRTLQRGAVIAAAVVALALIGLGFHVGALPVVLLAISAALLVVTEVLRWSAHRDERKADER